MEQINEFATTGQLLSDTVLRDMLVTFQGSLHRDTMTCISHMKFDVTVIGDRVNHIEDKMGEFTTAHNELVDAYNVSEVHLMYRPSKISWLI